MDAWDWLINELKRASRYHAKLGRPATIGIGQQRRYRAPYT